MTEFTYNNDFIKTAIKSYIELFDRVFEEYKNRFIKDKIFPIYILNTGDEVFMSNISDIGETKTELYDRVPRMVLSVKDLSIDTDQLTRPGNKTRIGAYVDDKLTMGWTSSRRVPLSLVINSKSFFSTLNEYLQFIEYYISIISNHSLVFSFYYNNVLFQGVVSPIFDYENDTNYDLGFDSQSRNKTTELNFRIDIQMPAYNIFKVRNLNSNDIGYEPGIEFDNDGFNDDNQNNDGSCNDGENQGGINKFIHNMYVNSTNEEGFVSRTVIPNDDE